VYSGIMQTAPAVGPTQPPNLWVSGALSLGVKWPGDEDDHSPLSSAEVKNAWSCTSSPPIRLHDVVHLTMYNNTKEIDLLSEELQCIGATLFLLSPGRN
jgi:hypothetical protein